MTLFELRHEWCQRLLCDKSCPPEQKNKETALFIVNQIVLHYLGRDYADSIFDKPIPIKALCDITNALEQKLSGRPLQYILGEWEFYGLRMFCGEGCLIPRPETELLAEFLIKKLPQNATFADFCTGSGCIAVSVLKKRCDVRCLAVDISEQALSYAKKNASYHGVDDRIEIACADLFSFELDREFDIIASNPPYIKSSDMKSLSREVLQEPHIALDGGEEGLDFYRLFAERYEKNLAKGGYFVLEAGEDTTHSTDEIFLKRGFCVDIINDYSGIARIVAAKKQ